MDERRRRQWAAAEAREVGYGGVSVVARATGLARSTIHAGLRDLRASRRLRVRAAERIRRAGAGRRPLTTSDPALLTALLALIDRLFSFISQNWRGKPLVSHQAIVNLIAATTTRTGLHVKAALDTRRYETALQVPDDVFERLRITPHTFHGEWNYTVAPRR